MGGGNPSRHPRSPGTGASPVLTRSIRAKHRVVLHREGSGNREDGGVQDGGGQRYKTEQAKGARRGTKHDAETRPPR